MRLFVVALVLPCLSAASVVGCTAPPPPEPTTSLRPPTSTPKALQAPTAAHPSVASDGLQRRLRQCEVVAFAEVAAHVVTKGDVDGQQELVTDYELRITRGLKGAKAGDVVQLQLPGGALGDQTFWMSGVPHFADGDHFLLLLDDERPGRRLVGDDGSQLRFDAKGNAHMRGRPVVRVDAAGFHLAPLVQPQQNHMRPRGEATVRPAFGPTSSSTALTPKEVADALNALLVDGGER